MYFSILLTISHVHSVFICLSVFLYTVLYISLCFSFFSTVSHSVVIWFRVSLIFLIYLALFLVMFYPSLSLSLSVSVSTYIVLSISLCFSFYFNPICLYLSLCLSIYCILSRSVSLSILSLFVFICLYVSLYNCLIYLDPFLFLFYLTLSFSVSMYVPHHLALGLPDSRSVSHICP